MENIPEIVTDTQYALKLWKEADIVSRRQAVASMAATDVWALDVMPLFFKKVDKDFTLYVGVLDPSDRDLIKHIAQQSRTNKIIPLRMDIGTIRKEISIAYPRVVSVSDAETVVVYNELIAEAIRKRVQDIFIEPVDTTGQGQIRLVIDGVLHPSEKYPSISKDMLERLAGLIRSNADVQPQNQNLPGDGHQLVKAEGRENNLRISTIPIGQYQRVCLRILTSLLQLRSLSDVGMLPHLYKRFEQGIKRPGGFITIAGPTGEGKSTTAYSVLKNLNLGELNVCSVENPVECEIAGVMQIPIQVNAAQSSETAQMTFAMAMRALLRQYPHFIFVGEIRDRETMGIALEGSSTGISLMATVHAFDALKTILRLEGLGAQRNEIAQSITMSISQRLLRKVCPQCRIEVRKLSKRGKLVADTYGIDLASASIFQANPHGCVYCDFKGYYDRIGAFEIVEYSAKIRDALEQGKGINEIAHIAVEEGYRPLAVAGLEHLANGDTDEAEVIRRLSYEDAMGAIRPGTIAPPITRPFTYTS